MTGNTPVRSAARRIQLLLILALPSVVVLFGGGFSEGERIWAGICSWLLVLGGLLLRRDPLPPRWSGVVMVSGLAALLALTAISLGWTPVRSAAKVEIQRLLLYLGMVVAALPALRERSARRATEPSVLLTAVTAASFGLSERLLPSIFDLGRSAAAAGRLAEPLGYWNAMGALCGLGLIITVRLAGDPSRTRPARLAAAAASPILSTALWLTYSRASLAFTAAGIALVVFLSPSRRQWAAALVLPAASVPAIVLVDSSARLRLLSGTIAQRESDGALLLLVLACCAGLAVGGLLLAERSTSRKQSDPPGHPPRALPRIAAGVLAAVLFIAPIAAVFIGTPSSRESARRSSATSSRLANTNSDRQLYWDVALDSIAKRPLIGGGVGAFRLDWSRGPYPWLRVENSHSLEIEVAVDLGLTGVIALALFIGGAAAGLRRTLNSDRELGTGLVAGSAMALAHSSIDWDWQLPGLVLPVLLMASAASAGTGPDAPHGDRFALRRAVLAAPAIIAILWLAHDWRAVVLQREAYHRIESIRVLGLNPSRYDRIQALLGDATWLNPDNSPRRAQAIVMLLDGRRDEAVRVLEQIVRSDPNDFQAWKLLLYIYAESGDRANYSRVALVYSSFRSPYRKVDSPLDALETP